MKLFWLTLALTMASFLWYSAYSTGFEVVATLLLIDIMIAWAYIETRRGEGSGFLPEKIEVLEKMTSEMFEKLNKRLSKAEGKKEDIIEWLEKF
jgi:hypothetical protein